MDGVAREGVFGMSINLDRIRLTQTNVAVNGRAYTLGNTIRFPMGATVDLRTLVHESTHVWQFQTKGAGYLSDSVLAPGNRRPSGLRRDDCFRPIHSSLPCGAAGLDRGAVLRQ